MKFKFLFFLFFLASILCSAQNQSKEKTCKRLFKLVVTNTFTKSNNFYSDSSMTSTRTTKVYSNYLSPSLVLVNKNGSFWEFEVNKLSISKSKIDYFPQHPFWHKDLKSVQFDISTRSSYNFNLLNSSSKLKFTLAPAAILAYHYKKNALIDAYGLRNTNIIDLNLEMISRLGINVGKRYYCEVAIPLKVFDMNYGSEFTTYLKTASARSPKFQTFNYLKEQNLYSKTFSFLISVGYKF